MDRVERARENRLKYLGSGNARLEATDPEFVAMQERLLYGEIVSHGTLTDSQRLLIILVVLAAGQTLEPLDEQTEAALRLGLCPEEIREALYQVAPYAGFPRAAAALKIVNAVFVRHGLPLPLADMGTVTEESRFRDGLAAQKTIFGDGIDAMHAGAAPGQRDIMVNYLSSFCFGDIYTRKGLDLKTRELLTFAIIATLGGCEPQLKAHTQGNVSMGNSKQNLVDAIAQMLPYIGFPRALNALACVNAVLPEDN